MSERMVEPVTRVMTSPVYVLRGGSYLLGEFSSVIIDSAGNFSAKTKGNPLGLAAALTAIAEGLREDVERGQHGDS